MAGGGAADSDIVEAGDFGVGDDAAADSATCETTEDNVAASVEGDEGTGAADGGVWDCTGEGVEGGADESDIA